MSNLLNQNEKYKVKILSWDEKVVLHRNQRQGQVWFIVIKLVEMEQQEGIEIYTTRFCIEFQNLKSSGFDLLEKLIEYTANSRNLSFLALALAPATHTAGWC